MMKALKRPLNGRRRTVAAVLAAGVVLGGAGAATAVAVGDDNDHGGAHATTDRAARTGHDDDHGDDHGSDRGNDGDDDHGDDHGGADDAVRDGTLVKSAKVDLSQAAQTATKSVAGTVTSVELDGRRGTPVWKVDVVDAKGTEHELTVDATDGKATPAKNGQDDHSDDAALAKAAKTDVSQGVNAALSKVPGTATSAELDDGHGKTPVWKVDVTDTKGTEHEVTVDATNGKVTATRAEQDGDRHHSGTTDSGRDHDDD